ncbi:hypothetical protein IW141_005966, partial [Coemansia sp. RSA 355]
MAISELVNSEAEAVEALDKLRSHESRGQFMQHVQAIPLVSSALEMYGRSRQSSALVRVSISLVLIIFKAAVITDFRLKQVGGDVIESGVRRMCEPIAKRIDMGPLDDFACRQLSHLGYSDRKRTKAEADGEDRVGDRGEDIYDGVGRADDRSYQGRDASNDDTHYQDRADDRSYRGRDASNEDTHYQDRAEDTHCRDRSAGNDDISHRGRAIDNAGAEDSRRGWGVGSL